MLLQANKAVSLGLWSKRLYSEVLIIDVFLSTGRWAYILGRGGGVRGGGVSYKKQLTEVLVIKVPLVKHLCNLLLLTCHLF